MRTVETIIAPCGIPPRVSVFLLPLSYGPVLGPPECAEIANVQSQVSMNIDGTVI